MSREDIPSWGTNNQQQTNERTKLPRDLCTPNPAGANQRRRRLPQHIFRPCQYQSRPPWNPGIVKPRIRCVLPTNCAPRNKAGMSKFAISFLRGFQQRQCSWHHHRHHRRRPASFLSFPRILPQPLSFMICIPPGFSKQGTVDFSGTDPTRRPATSRNVLRSFVGWLDSARTTMCLRCSSQSRIFFLDGWPNLDIERRCRATHTQHTNCSAGLCRSRRSHLASQAHSEHGGGWWGPTCHLWGG